MGITGLLPLLSNSIRKTPISHYKGKKIGIDGHSWLYQLSSIIAEELYHGLVPKRHLYVLNQKLEVLLKNKIIPVFVFDGEPLESKEITNLKRKEQKEKIKKEVQLCLQANNLSRAKELMKRCVSINENYLCTVLDFLKRNKVEFIISPYESDAQLAYLQKIKYIDCILTEDSDLILFGCTNILYKFDLVHAHEFKREIFIKNNPQNFVENLLEICILSGCDYFEGVPGVGLKTAVKLFNNYGNLEAVLESNKIKEKSQKNIYEEIQRAKLTFLHQVVYCPLKKKRVNLHELTTKEMFSFLGSFNENSEEFSSGEILLNKIRNELILVKEKRKESIKKQDIIFEENETKIIIKQKKIIIDENEECPFFKK